MRYPIKQIKDYRYLDEGQGEPLVLLHGLFGALSNFEDVVTHFSRTHRVLIPVMPIYDMPLDKAGLDGLVEFVGGLMDQLQLTNLNLLGNSLGGHVGLIYALRNPQRVNRLILTGSSGLFENAMGGSYPKRGNYQFVKEKVEYTFYDPKIATTELVEEVFEVTKSIPKCMRMVALAKSAQRNNLAKELPNIQQPTLLIWGLNDTITPPLVAHEFAQLLPHAQLRFIDHCGHAPMMEHPVLFNQYVANFLEKH
ncbi:MAG: alpha/beta hydrolase [Bernardetiaceae bacterium]|jgi:pimeloyl-ACP methyl ester carboxylesterase|nr:alpha/beta hydrolase [Bernardetiaceae bacterium]